MSGTRDDEKRVPEGELANDVDFEPEDELGDIGAAHAKLRKLKEELSAAKKERQNYLDGWQRCKADAINQRKDLEKTLGRIGSAKVDQLVEALIPALDSFDMAMGEGAWQKVDSSWRMGVENIKNQIDTALHTVGVGSFGTIGDRFDPVVHEIVGETGEEGDAGTIARVVRRGWRGQDHIIRPAHVVIFKIEGGNA